MTIARLGRRPESLALHQVAARHFGGARRAQCREKLRSPSKFPGSLGEPIVWDCVKLNALAAPTDEEQKRQLELIKFAKLHLLAEHYKIDVRDNPYGYATLAIWIAEDTGVPGFKVVQKLEDIPARGRKRGTGKTIDRQSLRRELDRQRADDEKNGRVFNISLACERLRRPTKHQTLRIQGLGASSLETAYHREVKERKAFEDLLELVFYRFSLLGIIGFPLADWRALLDSHMI